MTFSFPHRLARGAWPWAHMGNHDQGRPGAALRTASLRPRTMEKELVVKKSSELAQDRRAWSASVRDVVDAIGDAGSTHPE